MNHDMDVVENLVKCGNFSNQIFQLLSSNMSYENRCSAEAEHLKKCSDFYAKAVKTFRAHNPHHEQLTVKSLRDSTYDFMHRNGLDELFDKLAIEEIEAPYIEQQLPFPRFTYEESMQNYEDKRTKCVLYDDNIYTIQVHHNDHDGALSLFHDSKNNNIKIGTYATNYNIPNCACSYAYDTGLSTIHMKHALEAYDTHFTHESGHFYEQLDKTLQQTIVKFELDTTKSNILYVAFEYVAWTFEFRHILEKKNLSKEYIFSLGLRLPILLGNLKVPYYFSNLALSLANQPKKKLVDITNHALNAIKNGVVINNGEDVRTEFTCDSNASPDEYGIDSNGVVRFNAEKNKAAIRDLLTRMGYDADAVFERIDALTK